MPHKNPEENRTYLRWFRQQRRAAGLCTCKERRKLAPGRLKCTECNERTLRMDKIRADERRRRKVCAYCGKPTKPGLMCCSSCLGKSRDRWKQLKTDVLAAYGGPKCVCCGEIEPTFLCIDHIDGGGHKHRKEVGGGPGMYHWLKKHNYPPGFQVLCCNCNHGKHVNGICPHQQKKLQRKQGGKIKRTLRED